MKHKIVVRIVILLVLIILTVFVLSKKDSNQDPTMLVGHTLITVEIADSREEHEAGLMNRKELPFNEGMLFIFGMEERWPFWMKDTLIPLDMVHLDSEGKIVDILANVLPCTADPCPTYPPQSPSRYVPEVNAGFADENELKVGNILVIPPNK